MQILKAMTKKKSNKIVRSADIPVSAQMLFQVRDELKSAIMGYDKKFESIDKRFKSIDERFKSIDKRFDAMDRRFDSLEKKMDAQFYELKSEIHKVLAIVEEQNNRNKYVMDKQMFLGKRQDDLEVQVARDIAEIKSIILLNNKNSRDH